MLLVTRGENEVAIVNDEGYVEHSGYQVEVADTIGSGDAFMAAFIHLYLAGWIPSQILPYACAGGTFVVTQRGAIPLVNETFIHTLINHQILSIQTVH
jgi:fructokinase